MNREALLDWLRRRVAAELGAAPEAVVTDRPLTDLGLGSAVQLDIAADLGRRLGRPLGAELLYDHPTLAALATHLSASIRSDRGGAAPEGHRQVPMAVVGIGCRFPGAGVGPSAFFDFLCRGGDGVREVSGDRWAAAEAVSLEADPTAPPRSRWAGFLDEVAGFDAAAFHIPPSEAERMDPQQRLLLEASWHAIEDSGRDPRTLAGSRTGVFVGISLNEYGRVQFASPVLIEAVTPSANALSIAANRISYVFDLRGPSLAVDTACSSSLMAVHLACRSLEGGECDLALAGGVNVILTPDIATAFTRAGLMAADGRCKPFDAAADGYVRGEGVGVVVLKRLADAVADGDPIYATVLGSASHQDGRSNGLMAPRGSAQERVILDACVASGVEPKHLSYVEAHGTGTAIGDVVEATALGRVVGAGRDIDSVCRIGSVKSNLGHLEAAAGIAGLIKVALCLHHRQFVPTLHHRRPNPGITWEGLGLTVGVVAEPWIAEDRRLAGLSSFGFGGTNVHVIMEEAPPPADRECEGRGQTLVLSAGHDDQLRRLAEGYCEAIASAPVSSRPVIIAATRRRARLSRRLIVQGPDAEAVLTSLQAWAAGRPDAAAISGQALEAAGPVFVFCGQGAIWAGAGRDLFEAEAVFREAVLACDAALRPHLGSSVLPALFGADSADRLAATEWAQPALFALQVGLVALLGSWGVRPAACIGHSVGEVAAAHAARRLDLATAARIVARRALAMRALRGVGGMVLVSADRGRIEALLGAAGGTCVIAAENGPEAVVVAGATADLAAFSAAAVDEGLPLHRLGVDYAFHSPQMETAAAQLETALGSFELPEGDCPFVSTVDGARRDGALDAPYWSRNVREPVRFSDALGALRQEGLTRWLEIGPHPVLHRDLLAALAPGAPAPLVSLRRDRDGPSDLRRLAAALLASGVDVDVEAAFGTAPKALSQPPREWRRERYWFTGGTAIRGTGARGAFLDAPLRLASQPDRTVWTGRVDLREAPFLREHRVLDEPVLPASALLDMFLTAARDILERPDAELRNVRFTRLLRLDEEVPLEIQLSATSVDDHIELEVFSRTARDGEPWTSCATAELATGLVEDLPAPPLAAARTRCFDQYPSGLFYQYLAARGLAYGPAFRLLEAPIGRRGESLGGLGARRMAAGGHRLHPAVLDAGFHVLGAAFGASAIQEADGAMLLPHAIDRVRLKGTGAPVAWTYACAAGDEAFDLSLCDEGGATELQLDGFRLTGSRARLATEQAFHKAREGWLYGIGWQPARIGDAHPASPGVTLILCGCDGLGDRLKARLEQQGREVVLVRPGDAFRPISRAEFLARPGAGEDLRRVLSMAAPGGVAEVVHLWSTCPAQGALEAAASHGPASLAQLVQALQGAPGRGRQRLTVVTRGAVAVTADEAVEPFQAMVWGMSKALVIEHPDLACRRVDLDPVASDETGADDLIAELAHRDAEDQVAWRGGARYAARLQRRRLPGGQLRLREDGFYLVTGGAGALAARVAAAFAERGAKRVVLSGRSKVAPPRPDGFPLDVELHYEACDIEDAAQVAAMVQRLTGRFGPVRGVTHAAGVLDDCALMNLDEARLRRVLAPKVAGALALLDAVAPSELDFFAAFSSAAAVLGSPGQANYCAANAFLDALAHRADLKGAPFVSISWAAWSGTGMAAVEGAGPGAGRLIETIPPEVGIHLFEQIVRSERGHVVVLPFDLRALMQFYPSQAGLPFFSGVASDALAARTAADEGRVHARPDLETPYRAPDPGLEQAIASIWQSALAMTGIGADDELFALGGDSVFASQILAQISQAYGVRIDPEAAFDRFTVAGLAQLAAAQLEQAVEDLDADALDRLLASA